MSTPVLNTDNILRKVFDADNQALRSTAVATLPGGEFSVIISDTNDSIRIGNGSGNYLGINPDGSINANFLGDVDIEVSAADGDSIIISNGTNDLNINPDGSIDVNLTAPLDVEISAADGDNISINDGTNTLSINPDGSINVINPNLNSNNDNILILGTEDGSKLGIQHALRIDTDLNLRVFDATISNKLPNTLGQKVSNESLSVVLSSDQSSIPVTLPDEPIILSGTENGQPTGTEFTLVNTRKQQILAAKDRDQSILYADFGTKNERITQIDYTAPSIGVGAGFTARKTISYVLDGSKYRRTNITWSII